MHFCEEPLFIKILAFIILGGLAAVFLYWVYNLDQSTINTANGNPPAAKTVQADDPNVVRFQKLEKFKALYPTDLNSYVIRDTETGLCYLWLWGGAGNGGVGVTSIDCPTNGEPNDNSNK